MMVDELQTILTAEEAGAFTAQWAERRKVPIAELAERLGVGESEAESLMRQAKGRISMDNWLQEQKVRKSPPNRLWIPVAIAFLAGGAICWFAVGSSKQTVDPSSSPTATLPATQIQVDTVDPKENSLAPSVEKATPGNGRLSLPPGLSQVTIGATRTVVRRLDVSNFLKRKLPNDVTVEVDSPSTHYIASGAVTKNASQAKHLQVSDLHAAIHDTLLAIFQRDNLDSKSTPQIGNVISLSIGTATANSNLYWNQDDRDGQLKAIEEPRSLFYQAITGSILEQIRILGDALFLKMGHSPATTAGQ